MAASAPIFHTDGEQPECLVVPFPEVGGERRSYRGFAQAFANHAHEHCVIGLVREGERTLQLNERSIHIQPGDLIVFNPGDVHGCQQASETLFAYDSITIAPDVLEGAVLAQPKERSPELVDLFDQAIEALDEANPRTASTLTFELASRLETPNRLVTPSTRHAEAVIRVHACFCKEPAQTVSIAELAAAEGLSEYALIRAYRKCFSITPLQYLVSLRVERACAMLAEGMTPSDVAQRVGFADQAHLTRVFKQRIGTTPAAYARMAAREPESCPKERR